MKIEQYVRCWTKLTAILNAWTTVKALGRLNVRLTALQIPERRRLQLQATIMQSFGERIREYRHPISIHGIGRMRRN